MNDYQMSLLANDHSHQLLAEAQRERLAASAKRLEQPTEPPQPRRSHRLSLGFLLGRTAA